jgi:Tol biopolymer transport system component
LAIPQGARLGPYEILAPIGAGGMGEVYRARDTRLGRTVAVKLLPEGTTPDSDARRRFAAEARTISALNDPHIVAIYDIGVEGQREFIVMEHVEGETLRDLLGAGRIETRQALEFAAQTASGLAAAHGAGIVHRDIKPENLMVTKSSQVKILDFGLAKLEEKGSVLASTDLTAAGSPSAGRLQTAQGTILGTVAYMSPEQAAGRAVDSRTDIFSLGAVLYEMLTGRRAFSGDSIVAVLHAIINEEPRSPLEANPRLPREVTDVLDKAMAKDPAERYRHVGDLELDLRRARRALESRSVSGVAAPAPQVESRSRRGLAWTAAVLALAAAGFAGWMAGRSRTHVPEASALGEGTLTALTKDSGYEGEPTFSSDGQTIAYVADREGNFEIYLQQASGGPALNLTRNAAADIQPAFSPDGRDIAFVSDRASKIQVMHAAPNLPIVGGDIWIMPALGGPPRRIVEGGYCPSWTPDGSALLYVHGTFRTCRIARVPAAGGESRDIPIDDPVVSRYFFPSLSHDGKWLLYQNGGSVQVVSAGGGKPHFLAQGNHPAWGSGSASILFTTGETGKGRGLWEAPFSLTRGELSGPPRPLTFGRGADLGGKVSPDGSTIAFSSGEQTLNLEELDFDAESGRATGSPRELTRGNLHIGFFTPSPDGKSLAFDEGSRIWRLDPPSAPLQLTRDSGFSDQVPQWSPDGREIAFARTTVGRSSEPGALWIIRADGTSPRRITEILGQSAWLPDGKRMLVMRKEGLMLVDLPSGATTPVGGARAQTGFSLDATGHWVAYQVSDGGPMRVEAIALPGGKPQPVATAGYEAYHPFFSPSGRWLYFQPDHKNLYRVPGPAQEWKTAAPEKVTDFSGPDLYIEDPKISHDGTRLFYTRGRRTGDIYILRLPANARKRAAT